YLNEFQISHYSHLTLLRLNHSQSDNIPTSSNQRPQPPTSSNQRPQPPPPTTTTSTTSDHSLQLATIASTTSDQRLPPGEQ
ncbi:unnamed protein product, partial [Ilex paraguariensis]